MFAVVVVLAGAFVRMGNLMNSEIVGTPTTLPWGVVFERIDNVPRHPTPIYEALAYVLTFIITFRYFMRKQHSVINGFYTGWVFIGVFVSRFLIEFVKMDQVPSEAGMALNLGQWLSIPFILLGLFFVYRRRLAAIFLPKTDNS
jgi:phosphatidylglycerol:prolipoprotein diacylglycerol transferase